MTEQSADLSRADLLTMSRPELDDLYRAVQAPGSIPSGDTLGTAVMLPGRSLDRIAQMLARLFFWQGKVFNQERADLLNKISPFSFRAIRANVYRGDSWMDDNEATVLDYSQTSIVARWVRDEIREVAPGVWLGKVFLWKWHVLDFILTA